MKVEIPNKTQNRAKPIISRITDLISSAVFSLAKQALRKQTILIRFLRFLSSNVPHIPPIYQAASLCITSNLLLAFATRIAVDFIDDKEHRSSP
jgi:hypothetical protein